MKINTISKKLLADTLTPVSIYLRLRDQYAGSVLLESSDYHGNENSFSYICCEPIASIKLNDRLLTTTFIDNPSLNKTISSINYVNELEAFRRIFISDKEEYKFPAKILLGYMSYDIIQYFEDIHIDNKNMLIPDSIYQFYRFVIVIDHFKNELYVFEHSIEGNANSRIDEIIKLIKKQKEAFYNFKLTGNEQSDYSDKEFLEIIKNGKKHCNQGDVFQIVLSRRFYNSFQGDEFNVYRTLRSINPSPYLFYFDFGNFKIFGSSPESQILIKGQKASIFPIAGTFKRTGNDAHDAQLAKKLLQDEKEKAEHIMLVDLARNDLSRSSKNVKVEVFKEVQYYSHVIHLVSKVTGEINDLESSLKLVADTFPAGTLSGAPKFKAMELIDYYEKVSRNFFAGAIGIIALDGDYNHAIMIRSFLSMNNQLHYQAGAGIVAKSEPLNELKEIDNKLAALRQALTEAEII